MAISLRSAAFCGCFASALSSAAPAAEIDVALGRGDTPTVVTVVGEIEAGDQQVFRGAIGGVAEGFVVLDSPGGDLQAGIEIGKAIRLRGLTTAVLPGGDCASACALAWLGGRDRLLDVSGRVGFHAAYRDQNGVRRGNWLGECACGGLPDKPRPI